MYVCGYVCMWYNSLIFIQMISRKKSSPNLFDRSFSLDHLYSYITLHYIVFGVTIMNVYWMFDCVLQQCMLSVGSLFAVV